MATVKPFRGLLYSVDYVSKVVCPPYDVISPEEQENFYNNSPYNIIRVELGKVYEDDNEKNNVYIRARNYLEQWIHEGILYYDQEFYYYLYVQEFTHDGKRYFRPGIVAAVKLEDYETKIILPHEKTLPKPKKDRYNLLSETHTNVSQIFGLFSDNTRKGRTIINETVKDDPVYSFEDEKGVTHLLYRIPEKYENDISEALFDAQIFIADGHHRYETALNYRNEMRKNYGEIEDAWYEYVMMTLVPVEVDLLILPIHRIVRLDHAISERELYENLKADFEVTSLPGSGHLKEALEKSNDTTGVFGLVTTSNSFLLKVKEESLSKVRNEEFEPLRTLDTNILQELVLKPIFGFSEENLEDHIVFTGDINEAIHAPKEEAKTASFIMRPVSIETIRKVALNGRTMPQKTTYFYPKLWTGLVMRSNLKI